MQAIITKYLPCTNNRPSRIKAFADAGSLTVEWDYSLDVEANHRAAAQSLQQKLGWTGGNYGRLVGGGMPMNTPYGYCFVMVGPNEV